MAGYNRVVLLGNLTRDPQLSYTPANTPLCKFGIAANRKWKDREGNPQEDVCFVDCALFGRGAETFNQYMSKGQPVLVEGRLQYSQWTTPEGQKRSKLDVVVENFQFLGGRRDAGAGGPPTEAPADRAAVPSTAGGSGYDAPPPPTDDDVPF
jgi:single-strand DNA-binding protein